MLDPEPTEYAGGPVIHSHRDGKVVFAEGNPEQVSRRLIQVQHPGHVIELRLRHLEGVEPPGRHASPRSASADPIAIHPNALPSRS
jgi:hypothetical protein